MSPVVIIGNFDAETSPELNRRHFDSDGRVSITIESIMIHHGFSLVGFR